MSKQVYGKSAAQSRNVEKLSSAVWILTAAFIVFLIWTPFQVGLFNGQQVDYEKPIYLTTLFSSIMLLVCMGLYYKKTRLEEQRDLLPILSILLPITYALSLINAASHYMAMNLLFVQCAYTAVFIIALYLLKQKQLNIVIQNAVLTVVYIIVGFGLLNWLGCWKIAGNLVGWFSNTVANGRYLDAVMTDSNGLRLTSIFQYANTYAAFLMAFLFVAVFALVRSKKWYGQLTHGFMLVPIIVSLLLTLSRGGLVMLPVVFISLLLFLKPAQQILWIVHLALSGIGALVISTPITTLGTELNTMFTTSTAVKGWAYLIIVSSLVAILGWVIQRFMAPWLEQKLEGWASRKLAGLWLPVVSVVLVAIVAFLLIGTSVRNVLPDNIQTRVENINFKQHSVLERITFYKDAMKVVKDYPILGTGGGGWSSLYEKYQNNPYTSRQVHNFFLQYLIEVGIVGFLIFMSFIVYIFYKYIRVFLQRKAGDFDNGFFYFIIAFSILAHSLLDFNLSYGFMGILVFIGLAGMAAVMDSKPLSKSLKKPAIRLSYLVILGFGTVIMLYLSFTSLSSSTDALKAKQLIGVSNSYEELKTPLIKALNKRPFHPQSAFYLSSLDQQVFVQTQDKQYLDESYSVLTRALKDEPYNKDLLKQLVNYYNLKGDSIAAYTVYRDNADKFNWDIDWYSDLISRTQTLASSANTQKDDAKKQEYIKVGTNAFKHVTDGVEHLKTLPPEQLQGRPFSVTPVIALNAGKLQHLSGDTKSAVATLNLGLGDKYADIINSATLWDTNWYSLLIARSYDLAHQAFTAQDADGKTTNLNVGLEAYGQFTADLQGQPTPSDIALNAGRIQFMSGQIQAAANTLKSALSEDYSNAIDRETARWYLAALKKSGATEDQIVYNKLIAADANEAAQIDNLANTQFQ